MNVTTLAILYLPNLRTLTLHVLECAKCVFLAITRQQDKEHNKRIMAEIVQANAIRKAVRSSVNHKRRY